MKYRFEGKRKAGLNLLRPEALEGPAHKGRKSTRKLVQVPASCPVCFKIFQISRQDSKRKHPQIFYAIRKIIVKMFFR
jgi:hypothetical protein